MKDKSKKDKLKFQKHWKEAALLFDDPTESLKSMKDSKLLSVVAQRKLMGPSKTKAISIRLPQEDLAAIKEIAAANERPYQQIIAMAVEQYLQRLAEKVTR